jgi:hypothetical protein
MKLNPLIGMYCGLAFVKGSVDVDGSQSVVSHEILESVAPGYFLVEAQRFEKGGVQRLHKSVWSTRKIEESGDLHSFDSLMSWTKPNEFQKYVNAKLTLERAGL